jgi:hypothetical protein
MNPMDPGKTPPLSPEQELRERVMRGEIKMGTPEFREALAKIQADKAAAAATTSSPASPATAPTPAGAPKMYKIPAERFVTFLQTRPKTPIDQGAFALEFRDFNISNTVAQRLVDFCVDHKLFDAGHVIDKERVDAVADQFKLDPTISIQIEEDSATGKIALALVSAASAAPAITPPSPPSIVTPAVAPKYGFTGRQIMDSSCSGSNK